MTTRSGPFWDAVEGRAPKPRAAATLGWELIAADVDKGTIDVAFAATEAFTTPLGHVLGGFLAAMLYDTVGPVLLATLPGPPVPVDPRPADDLPPAGVPRAADRPRPRRPPRRRHRLPRRDVERARRRGRRDRHGARPDHHARRASPSRLTDSARQRADHATPAARPCLPPVSLSAVPPRSHLWVLWPIAAAAAMVLLLVLDARSRAATASRLVPDPPASTRAAVPAAPATRSPRISPTAKAPAPTPTPTPTRRRRPSPAAAPGAAREPDTVDLSDECARQPLGCR